MILQIMLGVMGGIVGAYLLLRYPRQIAKYSLLIVAALTLCFAGLIYWNDIVNIKPGLAAALVWGPVLLYRLMQDTTEHIRDWASKEGPRTFGTDVLLALLMLALCFAAAKFFEANWITILMGAGAFGFLSTALVQSLVNKTGYAENSSAAAYAGYALLVTPFVAGILSVLFL